MYEKILAAIINKLGFRLTNKIKGFFFFLLIYNPVIIWVNRMEDSVSTPYNYLGNFDTSNK